MRATWPALDDIRYVDGARGALRFAFIEDVRTASVVPIRADAWMGAETAGQTLRGDLVVYDGATLDVDLGEGQRLDLNGDLVIESGAQATLGGTGQTLALGGQLFVKPGATLTIRPGTTLHRPGGTSTFVQAYTVAGISERPVSLPGE